MKIDGNKISFIIVIISLVLLALVLRVFLLYIFNNDLITLGAWYDQFIKVGRIDAYKTVFYNYPPAYLYLLDVMTLFQFIPKLQATKLIPVIFDFLAAFAAFKLVEIKYPLGAMRFVGFFVVLFTPTVFIESGMWGQCDMLYTSFLLWSLYFILKEKPFYAVLFFSVALCFKLQAIFFAPIFIILFARKKFPVYLFLAIPLVYFISLVPAWAAGGPLDQLLSIYYTQLGTSQALSERAPNIYMFIQPTPYFDIKVWIGVILTVMLTATYLFLRWKKWKEMDSISIYFDAVFFTVLIPFFLPKMHERYFYTGCLLIILLAVQHPKLIGMAVLMQVSSLLSFIPYFSGWSDDYAKIGAILNCLLIIGLFYYFHDFRMSMPRTEPSQVINYSAQKL